MGLNAAGERNVRARTAPPLEAVAQLGPLDSAGGDTEPPGEGQSSPSSLTSSLFALLANKCEVSRLI